MTEPAPRGADDRRLATDAEQDRDRTARIADIDAAGGPSAADPGPAPDPVAPPLGGAGPPAPGDPLAGYPAEYHTDVMYRAEPAVVPAAPAGQVLAERQRERFGGIRFGSAFFGWLTATGAAVVALALLAAAGVGFGFATRATLDRAAAEAENLTGTAQTVGLVGGIVLLVVLFVAYLCGGYVAGRMARFDGAKQGLAVWMWGVVMALVVAVLAAFAGSQYNIFADLNLPRLPVDEGAVTSTALIAIGAAVLAALLGAVLGGIAGMRYHRRVDRVADAG